MKGYKKIHMKLG